MKGISSIILVLFMLSTTASAQLSSLNRTVSIYSKRLSASQSADFTDLGQSVWNLATIAPDDKEQYFLKSPEYGSVPALTNQSDLVLDTERGEYYVQERGPVYLLKAETAYDPFGIGWKSVAIADKPILLYPTNHKKEEVHTANFACYISRSDLPDRIRKYMSESVQSFRLIEKRTIRFIPESKSTLVLDGRRQRLARYRILKERSFALFDTGDPSRRDLIATSDFPDLIDDLVEESIVLMRANEKLPVVELVLSELPTIFWQIDKVERKVEIGKHMSPLTIQPNPSFGETTAVIEVDRPGVYEVLIKSVIGRVIQKYEASILDRKRIDLHFSHLKKGSYICSLVDDQGRTIQSRKLVLLKP